MVKKGRRILTIATVTVLVMSAHISAGATGSTYVGSGSTYVGSGSAYTDKLYTDDTVVDSVISDSQISTETTEEESRQEPIQEDAEIVAETTAEDLENDFTGDGTEQSNGNMNTEEKKEAEPVTEVSQIPETDRIEELESSIEGVYLGTAVDGCIVLTSAQDICNGYGLQGDEEPYAKFLNLNKEKSPVSAKVLELAAMSQGGTVGPMLNIEFGKLSSDDTYERLSESGTDIEVKLGIPESFMEDGKQYVVACVRKDGSVYLLKDADADDETVTFKTTGGMGAYAIIKY